MKSTAEIIEPYKKRLESIDYKNPDNGHLHPDVYLFQRFAYRIPRNWYGFSCGNTVPFVWALIISDFLDEVEKEYSDFEIHQIKLKMGSIHIHLGKIDNSVQKEIYKLEAVLTNKDLIY